MTPIQKFTIGITPHMKMYRIANVGGQIVDRILALRLKQLDENFFTEVHQQVDMNGYRIAGADKGNYLIFNDQNIIFTCDLHERESTFNFDSFMRNFKFIFEEINSVLQISDIRRIGLVAEYKYKPPGGKVVSAWLKDQFIPKISLESYTDKFQIRFEERALAPDGLAPDPKKADFVNSIVQIYDGALDIDHPNADYIFSNLDVQRYFTPVISGKQAIESISKIKKTFDQHNKKLNEQLLKLGAVYASQ